MITLYQFAPALGIRCPSPLCLKLETYLRMVNLPYEVVTDADLLKAPKKKFPYITDGDRTIPDSGFILDYLKETYGDPLDARLSVQQKAAMLGMRRLMEEHLYWVAFYFRWADEANWQIIKTIFFKDVPMPMRLFVPALVRKSSMRDLDGQGIGRHSREEVLALGQANIKAMSDFLGAQPYFMGEEPTSLDAVAYGMLMNIAKADIESPLKDYTLKFDNLMAHCERMRNRYWTSASVAEPVAVYQ